MEERVNLCQVKKGGVLKVKKLEQRRILEMRCLELQTDESEQREREREKGNEKGIKDE